MKTISIAMVSATVNIVSMILSAQCLAQTGSTYDLVQAEDIERRIWENRLQITEGAFSFKVTYSQSGNNSKYDIIRDFHIYINDKNKRMDVITGNIREVSCFNNVKLNHILYMSDLQIGLKSSRHGQATVTPIKNNQIKQSLERKTINKIVDPKMIGIYPCDFYSTIMYDINGILFREDKVPESVEIEKAMLNGAQYLRLSYSTKDGGQYSLWLDSNKGYNPVRVEHHMISKDGHMYISELNSVLKYYKAPKLWYPSKIEFCRYIDGKKSIIQNVYTLRFDNINNFGKQVFNLSGIGIPKGTVVRDLTKGRSSQVGIWNGHNLVSAPKTNSVNFKRSDFWYYMAISVSINFAAIGGLAAWLAIRKGKK